MIHYTNTDNPIDFPVQEKKEVDVNERIRELYIRAIHATKHNPADDINIQIAEKFAELIVRECARALDDKLANPNGASVAYCDGSDLLEHFGVEE